MSLANARRQTLVGWLWVSPWIVGFLAFLLIPVAMSLYYSFTDYPLLEKPLWIGLENYRRMFADSDYLKACGKTLLYAGVSIPLSTALALVIAALLAGRVRAAGLFQAAVFIPTLVPMAASAMIWLWLFNGEYGLINRVLRPLLKPLGINPPNWLTDSDWAMPAIIIISLWGVGQMVLVYVAALRDVPEQLYEAADLDGMGPVRKFFNVTLPMISPVILFNVITLTIGSLQAFVVPYVITKATPGGDPRSMYMYTAYMYDKAFVYGEMGYASAMAWVQLVVTLLLTGLMFLVSRKTVHYRGG